jgi:hypothetical protein
VNLTFVVAEQDMAAAALQLHQMFFQDAQSSKLLPGLK